jgi:hypothetical protein
MSNVDGSRIPSASTARLQLAHEPANWQVPPDRVKHHGRLVFLGAEECAPASGVWGPRVAGTRRVAGAVVGGLEDAVGAEVLAAETDFDGVVDTLRSLSASVERAVGVTAATPIAAAAATPNSATRKRRRR